jgi:hypothetical protein
MQSAVGRLDCKGEVISADREWQEVDRSSPDSAS